MNCARYVALGLLLGACASANAEVEKLGIPCETGICLYWWPKLPALEGWHREHEASLQAGSNALAPDGFDFSNAEVVIYARAIYKPRMPDIKSLDAFIEDDKRQFLAADKNIVISKALPLRTADGQLLRALTFFPKSHGNWELLAYGEEGDFYLVFALSSRSADAYRQSQHSFESLVTQYRAKPSEDPDKFKEGKGPGHP